MPGMLYEIRGGARQRGGAIGYPPDRLFEEIAYLAFHFHWPYQEIVNLDHPERLRWIEEICKINKRINAEASEDGSFE